MLNWETTRPEMLAIRVIAVRAAALLPALGGDPFDIDMDITACHVNGCRLDLAKLLGFEDVDFVHDVGGICRYLDRRTGQLRECFVPRCAAYG